MLWIYFVIIGVCASIGGVTFVIRKNCHASAVRKFNLAVSSRAHERNITLAEARRSLMLDEMKEPKR